MRCTACDAEIAKAGRFCPECAAPLARDQEATTMTAPKAKPPSAPASVEDGRFPPGTLLAGRYRIISLAGRGGMGEVYRATDIKLNHPVALKFLRPNVAVLGPACRTFSR